MPLTPLADVRDRVLDHCRPTAAVVLTLAEARGAVAAEDVVAATPVRPFASSAMDGYALRAADTPGRLRLVGEARAGHAGPAVAPGEAVVISTGAAVPPGADAVVRLEDCPREDGAVRVERAVAPGADVRPAGDDLAVGTRVLTRGTRVTAAHLGVLASLGHTTVVVHRPPRVGILTTGDELHPPGAPGAPGSPEPDERAGAIHDANRPLLTARVRDHGAVPVDLGTAVDDPDELARALREGAAACDLVVVTGGASVGPHDRLADVLRAVGSGQALQVALRPAKPFVLGTVGGVPVLGLPGNPVAAFVAFELLVRPAVRRTAGCLDPVEPTAPAVAAVDLPRAPDGRLHVVPVSLAWREDGRRGATVAGPQGSHRLLGLTAADGLALLPDGDGVRADEPVEVLPL